MYLFVAHLSHLFLMKFALIVCFINIQKLKNRVALSNRFRCVWTFNYL